MFYDRFKELCDKRGVSCNRAAIDMGLSNATPSQWKKKGLTPKADTLAIIANYFNVTVDYLLEEPNVHAVELFQNCGGISQEATEKIKPILPKKNERFGSEIMFALSRGGEQEITDEMFDEVKRFAAYVAQREKDKK